MRTLLLVALLGFVVAISGCGRGCGKSPSVSGRTRVAVSIFPIYDLVRRTAGPDADVTLLVPPERSESVLSAAQATRASAEDARLFVLVGLGFDDALEEVAHQAAPNARVLRVGDRVPTISRGASDDPYVWLDPERARLIVRAVVEELGRVDSSHVLAYRERASALDEELAKLDGEIERRLSPLTSRSIVTTRATFAYFADRYHLTVDLLPSAPAGDAAPSGVRHENLEAFGGTGALTSYEALLRSNADALVEASR